MYEDLQKRIIEEREKQIELEKQIQTLENFTKMYLSKEAISRYSNLKIGHPELALKVISLIAQAVQNGQLKEKINDDQFKEILKQIQEKKEFKIKRV